MCLFAWPPEHEAINDWSLCLATPGKARAAYTLGKVLEAEPRNPRALLLQGLGWHGLRKALIPSH